MTALPDVEVAFLDVEQGDTIIIFIPSTREALVVDCVDADAVIEYLSNRDVQHLRAVLITHLHLDHYSQTVDLLERCKSDLRLECEHLYVMYDFPRLPKRDRPSFYSDGDGHHSSDSDLRIVERERQRTLRGLLAWITGSRGRVESTEKTLRKRGFPEGFGNVIELLHPWYEDVGTLRSRGLNNLSAVLRVRGGKTSALLTGDLEPSGWAVLEKANRGNLAADVLKWPHHGAWIDGRAGADSLLQQVSPRYVVISVGTSGAQYSHPNDAVFEAIRHRYPPARLLCTQATVKCGVNRLPDPESVLQVLSQLAPSAKRPLTRSGSGCPCAGTIIFLLSDEVELLQPTVQLHRDEVISRFYAEHHQCPLFSDLGERPASGDGAISSDALGRVPFSSS